VLARVQPPAARGQPRPPAQDLRSQGDRWREDEDALAAWQEGRTGYPVVDAGMRQLRREGWMHNRARLLTASFLTKHLYLDWRRGAWHFMDHLVDGDLADNFGQWQWVAGTGTDSRPNRMFNPVTQGQRYDPDGTYVRRYVPELEDADDAVVHAPWEARGSCSATSTTPRRSSTTPRRGSGSWPHAVGRLPADGEVRGADQRGSGVEPRVVSSDRRPERPDITELTGELPRFVRDALGRPRPVGEDGRPQLGAEDAATVEALVDLGLDEDDARSAVEDGRVALVLAQRVIGGRPRYTIEQISERSGVPVALLRRIRVATGLPVPERFGRADLQWARLLARLLEVLPAEAVAATARARGTALATVVRSDLGMVRDELLLPMRQAGADDLTVAVTLAETARSSTASPGRCSRSPTGSTSSTSSAPSCRPR
jgi:hypothetical protein